MLHTVFLCIKLQSIFGVAGTRFLIVAEITPNEKTPNIELIYCLTVKRRFFMANRIYLDQTVVRVDSTTNERDAQLFNPSQIRYFILGGNFIVQDLITGFRLNLGGFGNIQDESGTTYANNDEVITYLNSFINFKRGGNGTGTTTAQDDRIFNSLLERNTYWEGTEQGQSEARFTTLTNGHLIAVSISGTVQFQEWAGGNNPTSYSAAGWERTDFSADSINTEPGSVDIGSKRLSDAGITIGAINLGNNQRAFAVTQQYDDNGSSPIQQINFGAAEDVLMQGDSSEVQPTAGSSYTLTLPGTPALFLWRSIKVIPAEAGAFSYQVRYNDENGAMLTIQDGFSFTQTQVDNNEEVELLLVDRNNIFTRGGDVLHVTLQGALLRGFTNPDGDFQNFLRANIHIATVENVIEEHPVTLRRDMPTEEDSSALVNSSLNENSALWILSANQMANSNRNTATIRALTPGQLDVNGDEIPTAATSADTIQLRAGTIVRVFAQNDFRVVNSPVLESDITNGMQPTGAQPRFTRFAFQTQPTSVAPGTTISGLKTFLINIERPDLLTGHLTILQGDDILTENTLLPTVRSAWVPINAATLTNAGDTVTFTIRATTTSGGTINSRLVVRAYQPHELSYWGIRTNEDFTTVDLTELTSVDVTTNHMFTVSGDVEQNQYIGILAPTTHPIQSITLFNLPGLDSFTRTNDARLINGVQYILYTKQSLAQFTTEVNAIVNV